MNLQLFDYLVLVFLIGFSIHEVIEHRNLRSSLRLILNALDKGLSPSVHADIQALLKSVNDLKDITTEHSLAIIELQKRVGAGELSEHDLRNWATGILLEIQQLRQDLGMKKRKQK